jgi:hypothetical protein
VFGNRNERQLNSVLESNWRASLVPAAAVIPAPGAYFKIVAVKKLVVGFLLCWRGGWGGVFAPSYTSPHTTFVGWLAGIPRNTHQNHLPTQYFEKKKVFQAVFKT